MRMNPWERRQKLLEILCQRRHETTGTLASEFNVCQGTIRRDIVILACSYPVESVQGKYGGIRVADWFHMNHRTLNLDEITFLRGLEEQLDEPDREKLNRIIVQFSH